MVSIFDFSNYRDYLARWIQSQPKKGRGVKLRFSKVLGVSSTMISFILNGQKLLSLEQASELADFIGLNNDETDFLFLLVERERAGNYKLRDKLDRRILKSQEIARKITKRVKKDAELSDELKAIYYSSWVFTGIRNLIATSKMQDVSQISLRLNLSISTVSKALKFLVENNLCKELNGQFLIGPTYTHVDGDSPFVNKHSQNWRLRGFTIMDQKNESDLFYTCPMSLSERDAEVIRNLVLGYIQEILAVMRPSPSETVRCLNVDWFEY